MADPSATPLSNADFRLLLATPRAERGAPSPSLGSAFLKPGGTPRQGQGGAGGAGGSGSGAGSGHRKSSGPHGGDGAGKGGGRPPGGKPGKPGKPAATPQEEEDDGEPKYRCVKDPSLPSLLPLRRLTDRLRGAGKCLRSG